MNLRVYWCVLAAICLMGCGSSSKKVAPVETIAATSGTPQSAAINTAFTALLVATVSTGGVGVSGATVTFTAPATGESGTFAGGTNTVTATTIANGTATSPVFTANAIAGVAYTVTATVAGVTAPADFMLTNTSAAAELTCPSGSGQSAAINTAFGAPLGAQVADSAGNPVNDPGVVVTFTPPATGASATFAGGVNTATTNASGLATSAVVSANGTPGGPYVVSAEAAIGGEVKGCNFMLTNTPAAVVTENFAFYLSGLEAINNTEGPNFYALAGAVTIDANGKVLAGEQDYNDAFGFTSLQPSGDTISGGTLKVDATTGQGTLSLTTNNTKLGSSGTETFGVQFVNSNHALIIQFDGSATSSGSMDLQTLPSPLSAPTGAFSFTISGVDPGYDPIVVGGVFSISGTGPSNLTGTYDVDDFSATYVGTATLKVPFSGTISAPDSFGRGTIKDSAIGGLPDIVLNYYIVGPEAIRIIDVDTADSGVGSAFGQGTGTTFSNASLGNSVFSLASNSYGSLYAAAGMFSTSNTSSPAANFSGVGDDNEFDYSFVANGASISGTYSVNIGGINGYGLLTITPQELGDISVLGIYMVDPNLNINDPNNTTGGGGALVADLDEPVVGAGVLVPQTDPSSASFSGNYAFGAQAFFSQPSTTLGWEFDFIGQGSAYKSGEGNVLSGNGYVSDPWHELSGLSEDTGVGLSGIAAPDTLNLGRYTMYPPTLFVIELTATSTSYSVAIYQASGGQLFWVDEDEFLAFRDDSVFGGSLQQQPASLTGLPTANIAAAKTKLKQ